MPAVSTPPSLFVSAIVLALLAGSAGLWLVILSRLSQGLSILPSVAAPPGMWPQPAVIAALGWIAFQGANRLARDLSADPPAPPEMTSVPVNLALGALVWLLLLAALLIGNTTPRTFYGMSLQDWPRQLSWGGLAFLAAIGPTWVALAATLRWRRDETQHEFLRLLGESPGWSTLALMVLTVAVVAPLVEELLFRVILQGWLTEHFGAAVAVPTVAVIFAAVHGWLDGLALVPLALILGYVFAHRRSYLAVVTTHSLFNSVMFGLQWLVTTGGAPAP